MDPVALSIFISRLQSVCDEMGAVLRRAAFSPNIKDRLDLSCAVFDRDGQLAAQAAHIPVHLGSMAYAMGDVVAAREWRPGDMVVLNDPFLGGTHLPDVTVVAPVFVDDFHVGFVANRAHYADIGASVPGSMPLANRLEDEGMVIPPTRLVRNGQLERGLLDDWARHTRSPEGFRGDLAAQISANRAGLKRVADLVEDYGREGFGAALAAVNDYGERLARAELRALPNGEYCFTDYLDGDGRGSEDLAIAVRVAIQDGSVAVDFAGTAAQTPGNLNCPLSVAAAGVYYVFRCLMPPQTPACAGSMRPIRVEAPEGSILNARRPAAVAAGNVETSTRVVDSVCGALAQAAPERIPAASQGTMSNLGMGAASQRVADTGAPKGAWDYYETLAGGMGAGAHGGGLSAVHSHMTNTRNTPIEVIERLYPVRVSRYAVRRDSGGRGQRSGGDGVIREYRFLADTHVSLIAERHCHRPWGAAGGGPGAAGRALIDGDPAPAKMARTLRKGQRLRIETPGGGGWGKRS